MKRKTLPIQTPLYETAQSTFGNYLRQIGYNPKTCQQMPVNLREFFHWLENVGIYDYQAVESYMIMDFYKYLQSRPSYPNGGVLSPSYISSFLYSIRTFYHYLQDTQGLQVNPMSNLTFPRIKYVHRESLKQEQIKKLYDVCENLRDRAFLGIYYGCGLRLSEGIDIKVSDIDFASGVLYVREGKGKKRRVVPINSRVANDFMSYYRLERPKVATSAFILSLSQKGVSSSWASRRIKYLINKAQLPTHFSLHHLRHSIATHLLENGMKVEQVSIFLGHSSLESTQIYAKISQEQLMRSI
jgi:integrase/recombinase XerD